MNFPTAHGGEGAYQTRQTVGSGWGNGCPFAQPSDGLWVLQDGDVPAAQTPPPAPPLRPLSSVSRGVDLCPELSSRKARAFSDV